MSEDYSVCWIEKNNFILIGYKNIFLLSDRGIHPGYGGFLILWGLKISPVDRIVKFREKTER